MIEETYHNGELIDVSDVCVKTPEEMLKWYKRYEGKFGYDVMIGNVIYRVKSCKFADNDTKIVTKVSRV